MVELNLWIHSCSNSKRTLRDSLEYGSLRLNCRTWIETSLRPEWSSVQHVALSDVTMRGVMLCDIAKMLTHPFTKCPLARTNVLFVADSANDTIY